MKAIEFPNRSEEFDFPDGMAELKRRLEDVDAKVNVSDKTLEILWYAFSERYSACWLGVDDETFEDFCEWVSKYSVDQANRMDAYGFIHE